MAAVLELPLDTDGECMKCHGTPPEEECLVCSSCSSPWHAACLSTSAAGEASLHDWKCPDCSMGTTGSGLEGAASVQQQQQLLASALPAGSLVAKARAIQADDSLTEEEKARQRQDIFSADSSGTIGNEEGGSGKRRRTTGRGKGKAEGEGEDPPKAAVKSDAVPNILDDKLNCSICLQLVDRPVTTACGHNFCLKCFTRWIGQGKRTCAKCRAVIPPKLASQPRINSTLVVAVRLAKAASASGSKSEKSEMYKEHQRIANEQRPEKAFTSERAVKSGKANACSGRIFVTIAPDHFGPITKEFDPQRGQGVMVGETWEDRMECRQWGAHFPHVAGIAGQSDYGAQSVALSGGYEDDMDMGEYFLYTGSGGRDLSGNKRTNKTHSFDQSFDSANEALRVSCRKGYPVRVIRSHKEKRSSYAPESGVRYDGIYRIEQCWRKQGAGGHLVCRYLFVRCDNEPAPWTSDEHGDCPRELPKISELAKAKDITTRKGKPAWDWKEEEGCWGWTCEPPSSRKLGGTGASPSVTKRKQLTVQQRLLKEFGCKVCGKVLNFPVSTPCGHNFCKSCLETKFNSEPTVRNRGPSGRNLRIQKVVKPCPASKCGVDISEMLQKLKVNLEMVDIIETLKKNAEQEQEVNLDEQTEAGANGRSELETVEGAKSDEDTELPTETDLREENGPDGNSGETTAEDLLQPIEAAIDSGEQANADMMSEKESGGVGQEEDIRNLQSLFPGFDSVIIAETLEDAGGFDEASSMLKKLQRLGAASESRRTGSNRKRKAKD